MRERIITELRKRHEIKMQGNSNWITMKCHLCGDSPNPRTKHLHMRLPVDDDIFLIKCFQPGCDAGGVLKKEHLMSAGVFDTEILDYISSKSVKNKKMSSLTNKNKHILPMTQNEEVREYFRNRIGELLTNDKVTKYKIILNINEFIDLNPNIFISKQLESIRKQEKNGVPFIGFLNSRETLLTIRSATDDKKVYIKTAVDNISFHQRHSPYIYTSDGFKIDEPSWVFFSEGIFDLFVVEKLIVKGSGIKNYMMIAAGGVNSYYSSTSLISKNMYKANYVYINDSDIPLSFYNKIIKSFGYRTKDIHILSNKKSKDFGDIREEIDPEKIKIYEG